MFVQSESGEPVPSANVYLYSHSEEEIVYYGLTDESGYVSFSYAPLVPQNTDENLNQYFHYLIYVQKTGYSPMPYSLTKIVGDGAPNDTSYSIMLKEDSTYTMPENYQTRSGSDTGAIPPFTVTKGTSGVSCTSTLAGQPTVGFCQHNIPLGTIHASGHSTVQAVFHTSDSIKVETGLSVDGVFSASGGRTEGFSSTTTFPMLAPASGRKQALVTVGRFERYYTTDSFSGKVYWYHELDSIIGGTVETPVIICSECGENWMTVDNDPTRLHIPVLDEGGEYVFEAFQDYDFSVSTGVELFDEGFGGSVGVVRKSGNSTEITYTPDPGYDILIYSDDMSWYEPHVTSRAS